MHYKYSPETGYIFLGDIELENIPNSIDVDGVGLVRKSEFHISIMSVKDLAPMVIGKDTENVDKQLVDNFFTFIETHNMKEISLTGEFRLVKKDKRITVIAMVRVPYLDTLFDGLRTKFKINFPTQPAHITLYTLQSERGIGLLSEDELISKSKVVGIPDLSNLKIRGYG